MMAKTSPTARALAELRKLGALAQVVERWSQFAKVRQDLFGFVDLLYVLGANIVAVQVTSGGNHASRKAKIVAEPRARVWLEAGGLIELWSYSLKGKVGKRKLWSCRKEAITLEDLG
jgi:hypothetical protein